MSWFDRLHPGYGIAAIRAIAGIILLVAGYQKLMVMGVGAVAGFFSNVGIPAPAVMAPLVVAVELVGGLLLIVGAFVRVIGLLMVVQFLVAAFAVNLQSQAGWNAARLDFLLVGAGLLFAVAGAGKLSVHEWLVRRRGTPAGRRATTYA